MCQAIYIICAAAEKTSSGCVWFYSKQYYLQILNQHMVFKYVTAPQDKLNVNIINSNCFFFFFWYL